MRALVLLAALALTLPGLAQPTSGPGNLAAKLANAELANVLPLGSANLRETRSLPDLTGSIETHLGLAYTQADRADVARQAAHLGPALTVALQALLGSIDAALTINTNDPAAVRTAAADLLATMDAVKPTLRLAAAAPQVCDPLPAGRNQGCFLFHDPNNLILVGSTGTNVYMGNNAGQRCPPANLRCVIIDPWLSVLLLDLGGDDNYANSAASASPLDRGIPVSIVLDLAGNDYYESRELATGRGWDAILVTAEQGGVALLDDAMGDDVYVRWEDGDYGDGLGAGSSNGAAILLDEGGNDFYHGGDLTEGASLGGGLGALLDLGGSDTFIAGRYSQGFSNSPLGLAIFKDL